MIKIFIIFFIILFKIRVWKVNTIRKTIEIINKIPAKPQSPYPQVLSWLFSLGIMFVFIYICDVIGI